MLSVNNLAKYYADQLILQDISFVLSPGERVGLIGPNGCGKTTLLRLIAGVDKPDRGSVFFDPALRLGYLQQGLEFPTGATLADVLASRDPRTEAALAVEHLAEALAFDPTRMPEYQAAVDRLEALGGYPNPAARDSVLSHLGLNQMPIDTPVATLSGGQKTRLGLARVLLLEPNVLLLDEPTNHLDLPMLEWLEDWLSSFTGAVLLVSHDRVFLDRSVNRVLYLDLQTHTLREYAGNYSAYLEQSLVERERQWQAYADQREEIARLQDAALHLRGIARFKRGGKADTGDKFARGFFADRGLATVRRARQVERRIERLLTEERIEKPKSSWQMKLDFGAAPASGKDVLRLSAVSVAYSEPVLLRDITLSIRQGEHIALVGANGSGKSTLIKTIAARLAPWRGEVWLGANVRLGYFAQEQDVLDPDSTPLETLRTHTVVPLNETEVRSFLHYFLFTGDQSLTPNRLLSYGERARLMLALLVAQGCNFLLLDEPINHLDIPARAQFEKALMNFAGTALAVTHDRYFIQGFATRIWAVQDHAVVEYLDWSDVV